MIITKIEGFPLHVPVKRSVRSDAAAWGDKDFPRRIPARQVTTDRGGPLFYGVGTDNEFAQPLLGAGQTRPVGHHLPTCAPPSTCSTSPVTWPASVR